MSQVPAPPIHGEVFTKRWIVGVLLDLVGYESSRDLAALTLVDPSCGRGAFLIPAVERLAKSLRDGPVEAGTLADAVAAYDLQESNVEHCRNTVATVLREQARVDSDTASWLAAQWVRCHDYLLSGEDAADRADIVVGNPPYIRLEDVPEDRNALYRSRWATMSGRADIYVGFFERALRSLKPGGRVGFICADRWMRNQYGAKLRKMVGDGYSVEAVWTMHEAEAFEAAVSSYPAITVISRRAQGAAVIAETGSDFSNQGAQELANWTMGSEETAVEKTGYRAFRLPHWFSGDEMWPAGSPERLALIEYLKDNFTSLHNPDNGTRVGIGVATGADRAFITSDSEGIEPSRLLPLAMVADTRSGTFTWGGNYLADPWERDGSLVDLNEYPMLRDYLNRHAQELVHRHVAKKRPEVWHRTIDKVHHGLTPKSKLLIQDMRTSINPVLDTGGHYPHHNLYYVVSDTWDMEVLGGLLLSRVAQAFIEAYCVRMRGGTLRFQSQYLKKIRVPSPHELRDGTATMLRRAFRNRDVAAATTAALNAYELNRKSLRYAFA